MPKHKAHAPDGERLGPSEVVCVAITVGELMDSLSRLNPDLPIYSGRNNKRGIVVHLHPLIDPSHDYVSYTAIEYAGDM